MQIFTLASGDYVYGAAALCNSLCRTGFKGEIHVGHEGELDWNVHPNAPIILHNVPTQTRWLGNYKPHLILEHTTTIFAYIDADCIVMRDRFIDLVGDAVGLGPVLCAEAIVPEQDIRRLAWRRAKEDSISENERTGELRLRRPTSTYFSSGFLCGDIGRDRWFLDGWKKLIDTALCGKGELFETLYFPMPDQDCLNAFIQDEQFAYSCISPPDIWYAVSIARPFFHVGIVKSSLLHCTGMKPWQHKTVPNRAPHAYELAWYHFLFEDTPWVTVEPRLPKRIVSWIQGKPWGKTISRIKNIGNRIAGL